MLPPEIAVPVVVTNFSKAYTFALFCEGPSVEAAFATLAKEFVGVPMV